MTPWSPQEDEIVLSSSVTADITERLKAAGYTRSRNAILSRRKMLLRGKPVSAVRPSDLSDERARLEQELAELTRRRDAVRQRLIEVRMAAALHILPSDTDDALVARIRTQIEHEVAAASGSS